MSELAIAKSVIILLRDSIDSPPIKNIKNNGTARFTFHQKSVNFFSRTDRHPDRQTGGQADRQAGRQADRQTGRQADRQTGRQADRQTGG